MIETTAQLEEFFRHYGPRVEVPLDRALAPPPDRATVPVLQEGMRYGVGLDGSGAGKRVRPLLCLLTAVAVAEGEAIADEALERALPFAVAMELMHNFALVHDDIEDGDEWRRGLPAVWKRYGLAHGINIGDGLLTRAFGVLAMADLPSSLRVELCALLAATLDETIEGQALDMEARLHADLSVEGYLDLVTRKTGRYLAAPLVGGALSAGAPDAVIQGLAALGPVLGPLFQILDDLIDLSDGKGRESVGNDVREGKRSYLAVHTLAHAAKPARMRLLEILDTPREATTDALVQEAADLMAGAGAMDAARAAAERLRQTAVSQIQDLQPLTLSRALGTVMQYLAGRAS